MWIDAVGPGGHVLKNNLLKDRGMCEDMQSVDNGKYHAWGPEVQNESLRVTHDT